MTALPTSIAELSAIAVIALVTLAFGIQKLVTTWQKDNAEESIVTLMHSELERMSKHNSVLAVELQKLQIEVIALNQQLRDLSVENQKLHVEVMSLTSEVTRLQNILKGSNDGRTSKT